MQLFIESTDADQLGRAAALGALDGVLLPDCLTMKAGFDPAEICALSPGPVIVAVAGEEVESLNAAVRRLTRVADNLLPMLPANEVGLELLVALRAEGIDAAIGTCRDLGQALLAAKAGARLLVVDANRPGLLVDIIRLYQNYGFSTEILASSLHRPEALLEAARNGVDAASLPPALLGELAATGQTDQPEEKRA